MMRVVCAPGRPRARRRLAGAVLAAAVAVLGTPAASSADTVVLKTGRRVEGRVVQENDQQVAIEAGGQVLTFERRFIAAIERSEPQAAAATDAAPADDALPGATEEALERLRRLREPLRAAAASVKTARAEVEAARSGPEKDLRLAQERATIADRELERLRGVRASIERAAKQRVAAADRRSADEMTGHRAAVASAKSRGEAGPVASAAKDLERVAAPLPPRDARRRQILDLAGDAYAAAAELELSTAADGKDRAAVLRAANLFVLAWRAGEGGARDRAPLRVRAIETHAVAHRLTPRGSVPYDVERALLDALGFDAMADLVEERLGPRRFGPVADAKEPGRFKLELEDGQTRYSDEIPTNGFARVVYERRERIEAGPAVQQPGGAPALGRARTERWFELVWDPKRRLWAQQTDAMKTEARAPAMAREAQPIADELVRVLGDRARAALEVAPKRDEIVKSIARADDGTGTDEAVVQARTGLEAAQKAVDAIDAKAADLAARLAEKRADLEGVLDAAQKARRD